MIKDNDKVYSKNSLYGLLNSALEGKYFQNIFDETLIIEIPKQSPFYLIGNAGFPVWCPFQRNWKGVPLDEFRCYSEISEERFKEIKGIYEKGLTSKIKKFSKKESLITKIT